MRAEFRLWHDRSDTPKHCFYAMFDPNNPREPIRIDQFPIACDAIVQRMQPLLSAINASDILSRKLFQVEFLASRSDDVVISLVYHRQLDEAWKNAAIGLEQQLNAAIIGRARKQRLLLSRDHVTEVLCAGRKTYRFEQCENSFTQPNAAINEAMINWVLQHCATISGSTPEHDLLELYCGNGNFTLPLASVFRSALGTEISKTSIASARRNATTNCVNNIAFVRMSSAETASALRGEREFRRLQSIDISSYNFRTVLVDPPRAGLDAATLDLVSGFDNIVYISCNPQTLAANLASLARSHAISAAAAFDQFPYTPHCEAGVILHRK